jgi:hypothetical protein
VSADIEAEILVGNRLRQATHLTVLLEQRGGGA